MKNEIVKLRNHDSWSTGIRNERLEIVKIQEKIFHSVLRASYNSAVSRRSHCNYKPRKIVNCNSCLGALWPVPIKIPVHPCKYTISLYYKLQTGSGDWPLTLMPITEDPICRSKKRYVCSRQTARSYQGSFGIMVCRTFELSGPLQLFPIMGFLYWSARMVSEKETRNTM